MLYLIGGCARSGKTILGKRLVRKKAMPLIPTDAIYWTLRTVAPQLEIDNRSSFPKYQKDFEPYLFGIARNLSGCWDDAAIEGATILPKHVSRLDKGKGNVRSVFIGWSSVNVDTVLKYEGANAWLKTVPENEREGIAKDMVKVSRHLEKECNKHNLPYVDMAAGPYRSQIKVALEALIS